MKTLVLLLGFLMMACVALAQDILPRHTPGTSVAACGMVADGITDNTPKFNACLAWAKANHYRALYVPYGGGWYRFASRPDRITFGLALYGETSTYGGGASSGNGPEAGTTFLRDYTETDNDSAFLEWNGADAPTAGYGGGLRRIRILSAATATGGVAIKLSASDATHHAAWMVFEDVGVSRAALGGSWFRDFVIDAGDTLLIPGGPGIRDISLRNIYLFCSTDSGHTLHLSGATGVVITGGGVYVPAAGSAGVYIGGGPGLARTFGVAFNGFNIVGPGELTIDYADSVYGQLYVGDALTVTPNASRVSLNVLIGSDNAVITNHGAHSRIMSQDGPQ